MCKSVVEGGQRCAAHTRGAYEAAIPLTGAWESAAAEYASTPSGRSALEAELASVQARVSADAFVGRSSFENAVAKAAGLQVALERGAGIRQANKDAAGLIKQNQPAVEVPLKQQGHDLPLMLGSEPLSCDELYRAWDSREWLETWNATPMEERRPIVFCHAGSSETPEWSGYVHAGDDVAAFMRAWNTGIGVSQHWDGREVPPMYLHTIHYRGNFHPSVAADTVANRVTDTTGLTQNRYFDETMTQECEEVGGGVDAALADASGSGVSDGTTALPYMNNSETNGNGPTVSIVFRADMPGWSVVETELISEDDERWDYVC
jgi:hypothetical protein